jgi:glycosyltransferase involved in cell wall biosynthesis
LLDLPKRTSAPLSIALGGGNAHPQGKRILLDNGWDLTDPMDANRSSQVFRQFLAGSAGELGIAKHGYVASRSGWFSERTCCYLASGRPAVVTETGWSDWLPEGDGLLGYSTADQAAAALDEIRSDPERHAVAARKLVQEHFEAADVCQALLDAL